MRRMLAALAVLLLLPAATSEIAAWRALLDAGKDTEALAAVTARAATHDPDALDFQAWFYDEGRGVPADKVRAAQVYRRAADLGQPHAQWRLGVMLDEGVGVAADPVAAVALFRAAAAQGFSNAYVSLGVMYSGGRGVEQSPAKAMAAYQEAARRGNPHGFNELGVMYGTGEGVAKNVEEALAYFIISATQGDPMGQRYLQQVGGSADKATIDRAMARAAAIRAEFAAPDAPKT